MVSPHYTSPKKVQFSITSLTKWVLDSHYQQTHTNHDFFLIFMRKGTKMGTQMEGTKPPQNLSFADGAAFGTPWGAQGHQLEPKGTKVTPQGTPNAGLASKSRRSAVAELGAANGIYIYIYILYIYIISVFVLSSNGSQGIVLPETWGRESEAGRGREGEAQKTAQAGTHRNMSRQFPGPRATNHKFPPGEPRRHIQPGQSHTPGQKQGPRFPLRCTACARRV